jgi:hypothetical protein
MVDISTTDGSLVRLSGEPMNPCDIHDDDEEEDMVTDDDLTSDLVRLKGKRRFGSMWGSDGPQSRSASSVRLSSSFAVSPMESFTERQWWFCIGLVVGVGPIWLRHSSDPPLLFRKPILALHKLNVNTCLVDDKIRGSSFITCSSPA